jgi:hypothetical protein
MHCVSCAVRPKFFSAARNVSSESSTYLSESTEVELLDMKWLQNNSRQAWLVVLLLAGAELVTDVFRLALAH